MKHKMTRNALALAVTSALCSGAGAQQAVEEVVVTAQLIARDNLETSATVSTLSPEEVNMAAPRNVGQIFQTIPGIRAEASSGEGNLNLSIRGVPVASGGSKYVQLLEDGLPVLQFGDIIVGNADIFLKADSTLARVEAVKGGSAAALASNSPAGVINFISKTGEEEGGSIAQTIGLDYDLSRTEFEYGGPLSDTVRFHIGGFYRSGKGERETQFTSADGGQLKFNLTKEFDNGYARVYYKYLNDRTPAYLPMPVAVSGSNANASIGNIPGFDITEASNISNDLLNIYSVGGRQSSIGDGYHAKSQSFGVDMNFDLTDNLVFRLKARDANNSGSFTGAFSAGIYDASSPDFNVANISSGVALDGATQLGALNGDLYSAQELANLNGNGLVQNIRTFDNDLSDLSNTTIDMNLSQSFDSFTLTGGYYRATQKIDVEWYWQTYIQDVANEASLLDAYDASGNKLTENGMVSHGAPDWGYCCTRDTDLTYNLDAFYIAGDWDITDRLRLDGVVRYDSGEAYGHYVFGASTLATGGVDVDGDGVIENVEQDATVVDERNKPTVAYDWSYASFSVGANYTLNDELSLYSRISKGGRANADRLGDGGFFSNGGAVEGSVENEIRSFEVGTKLEGDTFGGTVALFYVETDDVNSEGTNGAGNAAVVRDYESTGIELDGYYQYGILDVRGSLTWTDAEIVGSNNTQLIGNTPRRQADFTYSLMPSVTWEDYTLGVTVIGTTEAPAQDDNQFMMPGYTYVNLFGSYYITDDLSIELSVNNLFDEAGITESEEGNIDGLNYIRARSISGTSTAATLRLRF
ncbi:TonB-dependent receptor [Gilvimarinus sp. SDUM040013]|uniref:TonB-dependent receptor n=1 Tax=Gilvimarinus gilvus TaxID=3058038 RepID=A0ABU4S3G3_9GAMM|nr:TonB-dependent receptor [Gilvimarinus sp. SDUM040013]MDO3386186.1 TonB-dependent receptor [Gilvimarinus sp. SDUM040013]MDX6849819.1 TonB-dependent receptor [Gilvimarinus sp. SDUM040013]